MWKGAAMAIQNRLTKLLGIAHPVLLAPMDLVSGGRLAAAVSQAGGLGLLGGGYGDGDWIDREWGRAGNARIGCGFITWSIAKQPALLDRALAHHRHHARFWRPTTLRACHQGRRRTADLPSANRRPGARGAKG
jgi:Nitronate monooxygenase